MNEIEELKHRVEKLEHVLGTLISWIGQSSVGCLSQVEAASLLDAMREVPK